MVCIRKGRNRGEYLFGYALTSQLGNREVAQER